MPIDLFHGTNVFNTWHATINQANANAGKVGSALTGPLVTRQPSAIHIRPYTANPAINKRPTLKGGIWPGMGTPL